MKTQAPATITHTELDWVCITQRASYNDPSGQLLWVQAALAMSDVIMVCNVVALDEAHAAHAQHLVNRLAFLACKDGTEATAMKTERLKDQIMHLAAGAYDARALLL